MHTADSKYVLELMKSVPPDYKLINTILSSKTFRCIELADIAIDLVDYCCTKYYPDRDHSGNYLYTSIVLLLLNGLDPNECGEEGCALWALNDVDTPGVAGHVMRLLIEFGGDINKVDDDGFDPENLFESLDEKITEFDRYLFQSEFDCWLVCLGYGGKDKYGRVPIKMVNGHSIEELREFERFEYAFKHDCFEDEQYGKYFMKIIDKKTKEIVAVYPSRS